MTTCRIRVNRDTPTSGSFEWVTLGKDGAVLASGSADLRRPPITGACEVVLASDLVLLERVAVPLAQQQRLASALRYLVEDSTIADPDRLHVVAAPSPDKGNLHLAIVDRQWLEKLLSALESAGLIAQCAYPESLLPQVLPHTWTVVWNGNDSFARTGEAEGFALDRTDAPEAPVALRLAVERARHAGTTPHAIRVRTAADVAQPDTKAWSDALGIAVELAPAWHWATAPRRSGLDLLQGEFASRAAGGAWLRRLRRPAILVGALLVLGTCGIAADWGAKVRERRALLAEMSAIYRETFGERAVVVDPPLQMNRALTELRQQAGLIGPADFLALLERATDQLLNPQRHRIESITYDKGTLTVTLRPLDPQGAGALLEELRSKSPPRGLDVALEAGGSAGRVTLRLRTKPGAGTLSGAGT